MRCSYREVELRGISDARILPPNGDNWSIYPKLKWKKAAATESTSQTRWIERKLSGVQLEINWPALYGGIVSTGKQDRRPEKMPEHYIYLFIQYANAGMNCSMLRPLQRG